MQIDPHVRDARIDNLKCIATFSVIWAHTGLSDRVMHCRTYDVVLLFMLSGMSLFYQKNCDSYNFISYFGKRIKKLLLPAYGIMTGVYLVVSVACFFLHREQAYTFHEYLLTILLTNRGLGFIWIVKIFLLAAAIASPLKSVTTKIRSNMVFLILFVAGLFIQQLLCVGTEVLVKHGLSYFWQVFLEDYIAGCFGYIVVYAAGLRLIQSKSFLLYLLPASLIIFVLMQFEIESFCPNDAKYPPNLYYLSYGLLISSFLWAVVPNRSCAFCEWVGKHSWDIYLYHIPFYVMTFFVRDWRIRYPIILLGAFLTVWVLPKFLDEMKKFLNRYRPV